MQQESPTYTWQILIFLTAFMLIVALILITINNYKIDDLYNQTRITISNDTQTLIDQEHTRMANIANAFGVLTIVICVLSGASIVYNMMRWRKFRKSIKLKTVKTEVKK